MIDQDLQYLRVVPVAPPAPGQEWSIAAPGQGYWRILAARWVLVTDANVANRHVSLLLDDQTDVLAGLPAGAVQAAGLTQSYSLFPGSPPGALAGAPWLLPAPTDGLVLMPGFRVRSSTVAIQVGDQYSAIRLYVEELPTGPRRRVIPTVPTVTTERV